MNDYEHQVYEDTEAQAYGEDQWFENMEYLEAYDDVCLDEIEEDPEEINDILDIIEADRMARENGEKPAAEWVRQDFKDLLHRYPKLRHLRTCELQALLLTWGDVIDGVVYYKLEDLKDLKDLQQRRDPIWYVLAIPKYYSFERLDMAVEKLWKIRRNLEKTREKNGN